MRLDPTIIAKQIADLKAAYPDLWGEEEDWSLALSSETELDEMLTKLVRMIEDSKALIEGTGARMDELKARQDRFKRRIEAYRSLIFKLMEAAGLSKRELAEATLSLRAGSQKVVIVDEAALPDIACKMVRRPDLAKIKELLTDDTGACAGAMLSNAEPNLTIRVR